MMDSKKFCNYLMPSEKVGMSKYCSLIENIDADDVEIMMVRYPKGVHVNKRFYKISLKGKILKEN